MRKLATYNCVDVVLKALNLPVSDALGPWIGYRDVAGSLRASSGTSRNSGMGGGARKRRQGCAPTEKKLLNSISLSRLATLLFCRIHVVIY